MDTTGFINEENISQLLYHSSDGEIRLNNLMLFEVTKMLNSISPHYSTGCQNSLAVSKLLGNKNTNGKTSTESLPEEWLQVRVKVLYLLQNQIIMQYLKESLNILHIASNSKFPVL